MNIFVPGLRDRRVAAADENQAAATQLGGNRREIYGTGTPARRLSESGRARDFDVRAAPTTRDTQGITTIILHQTDFFSHNPLPAQLDDTSIISAHRLDRVIAHFVVRSDGNIIYTHDIEHRLNNISGQRGIDIEFEGRYGSHRLPRPPRLNPSAILSGRRLVSWLIAYVPSIQYIHPHGQLQRAGGKRDSCSGPDIWVNIGEWAVANLQLRSAPTSPPYPNLRISEAQCNPAYRQEIDGFDLR
jgi:hypothetical protein